MSNLTFFLVIGATAFSGILAGASLDQSIKQLPAGKRMGAAAYAEYAKAADLGNGVLWYVIIGIGAALLTIAAAVIAFIETGLVSSTPSVLPLYMAGILAVLHTIVTTQAAPTMFSVREAGDDEAELARIFDRFERWQTLRAILQVLTFVALLWFVMDAMTSQNSLLIQW